MAKKMRAATRKAIKIALENLGNPDSSIRKACKAAGITPATLYNNTTHKQLEDARKQVPSRRVQRNPSRSTVPAPQPAVVEDTEIDYKYVAKLQKKLLDRYEQEG